MDVILYGIGEFYRNRAYLLPKAINVIAYGDSDEKRSTSRTGNVSSNGIPVVNPKEIESMDYDLLYICTDHIYACQIFNLLKGYRIDAEKIRFLCREEPILYPGAEGKWEYRVNSDWSVDSKFGEVRLIEKSENDHSTIAEIFGQNIYHMNLKTDTVVIDMGMNVGTATLYFAGQENVSRVYGFEPFPDTYKRAIENIGLNSSRIKDKIVTSMKAVSDHNGTEEVSVITDNMGWRSIFRKDEDAKKIEIEVISAEEAVKEIVRNNPGKNVMLKIDTEGSEYQIFDSMDRCGLFRKIDSIVMEYHGDPKSLINTLLKNGFTYHLNGTGCIGLIDAFRRG